MNSISGISNTVSYGQLTQLGKTSKINLDPSLKLTPADSSDQSEQQDQQKNTLDSLVQSGTITKDQEKDILSALLSQKQDATQDSKVDPLDELVNNGTITKDQEKAVEDAFKTAESTDDNGQDSTLYTTAAATNPDFDLGKALSAGSGTFGQAYSLNFDQTQVNPNSFGLDAYRGYNNSIEKMLAGANNFAAEA